MKIPLTADAAAALTYQSYGRQPAIDGVFHHPLAKHRGLEGWFMEHLRVTGGVAEKLPVPFEIRQISVSRAKPGRVNAFHIHPLDVQDELWCCVQGSLLAWLADLREGSPTAGVRRPYVLTAEAPALLHIPAGVAHGYKGGTEGALLLYAINSQFNAETPNEGRLPWDHFGADLWEEDRG